MIVLIGIVLCVIAFCTTVGRVEEIKRFIMGAREDDPTTIFKKKRPGPRDLMKKVKHEFDHMDDEYRESKTKIYRGSTRRRDLEDFGSEFYRR